MLFMNLTSGNTVSAKDEKSIDLMRRSKNYIEVIPVAPAEPPAEDKTPAAPTTEDETPEAPPAEPDAPKSKRGRKPKNQE